MTPLLAALGAPWLVRQIAATMKPSWDLSADERGLLQKVAAGPMTQTTQWLYGQVVTFTAGDGSKHPGESRRVDEGVVTIVRHVKGVVETTIAYQKADDGVEELVATITFTPVGAATPSFTLRRIMERRA